MQPHAPPARRTVAAAMLRFPALSTTATTVAQARRLLGDPRLHALLLVEPTPHGPVLRAVVTSGDLTGAPAEDPALPRGRLHGRVVAPGADLAEVTRRMAAADKRRLAVTDARGVLLGLLCRKRSGDGFCADRAR